MDRRRRPYGARNLRHILARRYRHLGLQRRIMLFVTMGLAVMFGVVAYLGLGAIDEASNLVYEERLTTGYTTAGILERDFERIAANVVETASEERTETLAGLASTILSHLRETEAPYPFFQVTGVWLVDASGTLVDDAGLPVATAPGSAAAASTIARDLTEHERIYQAVGSVPGQVPLATLAVSLTEDVGSPVALVQTVSVNSTSDYAPATYGRRPLTAPAASEADAGERYQLEVIDPDGVVVLGIGSDEHPGELSHHFPVVQPLMERGEAATLLHEGGTHDSLQPHVMAAVPLTNSPLYVVLEQPVDVALALPNQLRSQLLIWIVLGFSAALVFAWFTTRRVVKPTEQLTSAAERMATGDLASPISVDAQDEVARLADSLDTMRVRLKDAHEAIERTNRELESRVAARTAQLGRVLRQTISAQEEERRRLARELHDETAQTLGALTIALDRARDEPGAPGGATANHLAEAKAIAVHLLDETRRLILGLRPSVLDDLGLVPALRWYCESTFAGTGVSSVVEASLPSARLPAHIEVALFRIVQEAINNVARHANAKQVSIRLVSSEGTMRISIVDDGTGFDVDAALAHPGDGASVGLIGMQERVKLLNGRMKIRSVPGEGTTVQVQVPIGQEPT